MNATDQQLALVVQGAGAPVTDYIRERRTELRDQLRDNGAILFRGFDVGGVSGFDDVVRELSGAALSYSERSSPRSRIEGNVYTSTEYPAEEEIFAHNENSYQAVWPLKLYFYCIEPALTQGATPLSSTERVYQLIDPSVREDFTRRQWMVTRNFGGGFGLPWTEAFNTDDRDEVTERCRTQGIEATWLPGDRLRTRAVRQAVHQHPETGATVWFNHATFFHVSTLPAELRDGLLSICAEEDLPTNTYYGDGETIPADVLDHLRECYRAASTRFDYERDDVLVLDNMLTTHGREPFTGPRKIAVAMAEPSS